MKLGKAVTAYKILETLPDNDIFTDQDHYNIFMLMKSMRDHVEFSDARVDAIKKQYNQYADKDGKVTGTHADDLICDIDKLMDTDIDLQVKPIDLPFVSGVNYKVMCALDGFVNFHLH